MPLGADVVTRAFALLAGRDLDPAEAAAKAAALGSKQELLAYLVVRQGVLAQEPALREILRR